MMVIQAIVLPRSKTMYVSVQSTSIPYSFYNVDGFNDTLVYSVGGGSNIVITIPITIPTNLQIT